MSSLFNLDNLCRDPEDGAYHCPSCQAPFTRRSNLRRHFVIHTRSMPFRCNVCDSRFSRSDELHYHSLACTDTSNTCLQEITRFSATTPFNALTPLYTDVSTPFLTPDSLSSTPSTESSAGQGVDQAFTDFMSCLSSSPATDLIEGLQPPYDQLETLEGLMGAAHTVPSTAPTPSPMHQLPVSRNRIFPRRNTLPYNAGNRRKKLKEKPIYTRRQVDDMLSAVGSCFAGTMEEVLKRVDINGKFYDKAPDSANEELRKILNDTLPRLFSGLQNFLDERTKAD